METNFMNTENSKTNESNKLIFQFTDKRNLKNPNNKNIGLVNLSIYYTLSLHITKLYLKYLLQLGTVNLSCLMVLIQFMTFKITLSLTSRNTKL